MRNKNTDDKNETKLRASKEDINKQNEQLKIESQPMCLTDAFVNWPGTLLLLGFALLFASTYFALKMNYFVMDYQSHRDILVWTDPIVKQSFM